MSLLLTYKLFDLSVYCQNYFLYHLLRKMHETIITCVTRNLVGFALVTVWPHFSVFVADHTLVAADHQMMALTPHGSHTWMGFD